MVGRKRKRGKRKLSGVSGEFPRAWGVSREPQRRKRKRRSDRGKERGRKKCRGESS